MPADIHAERILVLDFGSQYAQLIARRVREAGCYCEIYPCDAEDERIRAFAPRGVILSGGPESATSEAHPGVPEAVLELDIPVLGICYGMQALARRFGAAVHAGKRREFGHAVLQRRSDHALLDALGNGAEASVWMSHGDHVETVPDGFAVLASTENVPIAAIAHESRPWFGLQFHPEVTHTPGGQRLLESFVREQCRCHGLWSPAAIVEDRIAAVRAQVGGDGVVLALSGGVDSSVVAALLARAVGEQLTCIFVDNGLLRLHEADQVMAACGELGVRVRRIDAQDRFLDALAGVAEPEEKRRVIGREFVHVFQEEAQQLANVRWLAQGTIYPDVIESAAAATNKAHLIKSHHNVGGLPETLHLQLVEPLRELFKDEVREVGRLLGLSAERIGRHPFPGPGLAVRILGEVRREYADLLRAADHIFLEELRAWDLYDRVAQAFVVFLPVRAVGVMGDGRRYDYVVSLRAVETQDFMTAQWARLPSEFLERCARRIINEVDGIARVCYDISSKPPATVEWE